MDGRDLNHIFPGREGGDVAEVYAHRILERIVNRFDDLVDLHTASFGRVNSVNVRADMTHSVTATMAYLQRPQIIVHNPPSDYTLRGAAMDLGIPAITLEIGDPQKFQPNYVRSSRVGLRAVLAAAGMLPRRAVSELAEPVLCERSYWMYADRGGFLEVLPRPTDRVRQGELVETMSGGERQGIAISRALYFDAELIILDEPTMGLSLAETEKTIEFIQNTKKLGKSCIFIDHNIFHVYPVVDRIVVLDRGRVTGQFMKDEISFDDLIRQLRYVAKE